MKKLITTKILKNIFIQFILGFGISVYLIAILMWGSNWHIWNDNSTNSVVIMGMIYVCSFWSLRRFTSHLGTLTFRYIIPVFSFWTVLITSSILIFRLGYSVWYMAFSNMTILLLLILFDYIIRLNQHKVIGYIPTKRIQELPEITYITWKKLESVPDIDKSSVDVIMADLRADLSEEWQQFLADCTLKHVPVYHSSRLLERVTGRVRIDHLYENEFGALLPSKSYQIVKRLFDIGLIVISLPLTFPIMVITGLLVMLESRGGIFFEQERIGQGGKKFMMYKFRSMYTGTATDKTTGNSDARVTRIGKFIRKVRIDELPQFYNVLRGEMSLIGPRAEFHKFAEEYEREIPFYSYRHIVKPGISGWAQVVQGYNFGVNETKIKLEYDFYYIKNFSFSMDLLILFKTIQTMLTGFGAR